MRKKAQIQAIANMAGRMELGYLKIPGVECWWHSWDCPMFRAQVETEEKEHRAMGRRYGQSFKGKLSPRASVDLFICQYLLNYRTGRRKKPEIENIGHFKLSLYYAWNVWTQNKASIRATVSMSEARQWLDSVSYSDLMGVGDS